MNITKLEQIVISCVFYLPTLVKNILLVHAENICTTFAHFYATSHFFRVSKVIEVIDLFLDEN